MRSTRIGAGLVLVVLLVNGLSLSIMTNVGLIGDEHRYVRVSIALWSLLDLGRSADMPLSELRTTVVGAGWFLPGMGLVLSPPAVFDAGVGPTRAWMGLVNTVTLLATVKLLSTTFGRATAVLYGLLVSIFPMTALFWFTAWGDVLGGQLLVLLATYTYRLARDMAVDDALPNRDQIAVLGLGLLVAIYIRPPTAFLAPFLVAMMAVGSVTGRRGLVGIRPMIPRIAGLTVFVLCGVLPWSILVSTTLGHPYLLTTSSDLSWIVEFADQADADPHGQGRGDFYAWHQYFLDEAERTGSSYGDVISEERRRVAANVTPEEYRERALRNLNDFVTTPNGFVGRFLTTAETQGAYFVTPRVVAGLLRLNSLWWAALCLSALALPLLDVLRRSKTAMFSAFGLASVAVGLMLPFVSSVHSRHLVYFVPIMTVTAVVALVTESCRPAPAHRGGRQPNRRAGPRPDSRPSTTRGRVPDR